MTIFRAEIRAQIYEAIARRSGIHPAFIDEPGGDGSGSPAVSAPAVDAAPSPVRNPEADVIDAIDELVDESLAAYHQDDYAAPYRDRCGLCGQQWHGAPGVGKRDQMGHGLGAAGCPGAYGTEEQRAAWTEALIPRPPPRHPPPSSNRIWTIPADPFEPSTWLPQVLEATMIPPVVQFPADPVAVAHDMLASMISTLTGLYVHRVDATLLYGPDVVDHLPEHPEVESDEEYQVATTMARLGLPWVTNWFNEPEEVDDDDTTTTADPPAALPPGPSQC